MTVEKVSRGAAAVRTLENLGYTYHGGELWEPPIGEVPERFKFKHREFDKASDAVIAFENGEDLYTHFKIDRWVRIMDVLQVIPNWSVGKIYCKVEIDWCDIVEEFLNTSSNQPGMCDIKFGQVCCSPSDDTFIRMCHLVASLTEQPK